MMLDKNLIDKEFFYISAEKNFLLDLVYETTNILQAQAQMKYIEIVIKNKTKE